MSNLYNNEKRISAKFILLLIASTIIIISLILIFGYNKKTKYENSFHDLIDAGKYDEALELYREIQGYATNINASSEEQKRYSDIQVSYEFAIENKTAKILDRLKLGDNLNHDDKLFIISLDEVTASVISPFLNKQTEDWLDGKIDYEQWKHLIVSFKDFPNLKTNVNNLLGQEEKLILAADSYAAIDVLDLKENWNAIWTQWQELSENSQIGRFAQKYASYRLKVFQEDIYSILIDEVDQYIARQKYYTAKLILDRLFDAFPNQVEIQEKLQICNEKIPDKLIVWEDNVENISIRPLIVDTDKALNGPYKTFAETGLLTVKEFENMLYELYENDYILISSSLFYHYPENFSHVIIPEGKKPLVLIFEQFQYSTSYVESGTIEQLAFNQEKDLFVSRLKANRKDTEKENLNAISILENFINEYSDFSFDGAKATLALTIDENILGYTINEEQTQKIISIREIIELDPFVLANKTQEEKTEFYQLQMNDVKILIQELQEHGYNFCNASYGGEYLNSLSLLELKENIKKWEDMMLPMLGEVQALLYPGGSHVYNQSESLDYLIKEGYCNFYSESPSLYNLHAPQYLHFDFTPISGNSLMNSDAWNLDRFGNIKSVIEPWRE